MAGLKSDAKSLLSNTLLFNTKLLSKLYNELAKQSLKKYKQLTVEDYNKEKK